MDKENKLKTTIYLPESIMWLLRETAVKERISSDSAAMEAAIRCWHNSVNNEGGAKFSETPATQQFTFGIKELDNLELSGAVRKSLRMLIGILLSEKDDAIRAVRENLEIFYKYAGGDPEHGQAVENEPSAKPAAAAGPGAVGRDALPYRESGDDLRTPRTGTTTKINRRPRTR